MREIYVNHRFDFDFLRLIKRIFMGERGGGVVDDVILKRIDSNVKAAISDIRAVNAEVALLKARTNSMWADVERRFEMISTDVQNLIDAAKENNTVTKSLEAMFKEFLAKVEARADDEAAIRTLVSETRAETSEIIEAVKAGTPVETEPPVDPIPPAVDPATGRPRVGQGKK